LNKHERRNACRRFNSTFIFGFLVIMLLHFLRPVASFSELENRYLKNMPHISIKSVLYGTYMQDLESYVTDRFVFRKPLLMMKSKLEYLTGKKENNGVYICDDDYLIEKPPVLDETLVKQNLAAIRALGNTNQYHVTISIVPPAYEILKEKLPRDVYHDTIPKLNRMISEASATGNITNADATDLLQKYRNDYLYFKTDSHLTANGAFVVYHELTNTMGITPLRGDDFKISDVSRSFLGDTYSKAMKTVSPDVICDYRPLETPRFKVRFPYEGTEADSMYFPAHLEKKDKYPYFLDDNHALTIIESPHKNGKQLMVFKDDYANSIVPFLANHFETIYMVDLAQYDDNVVRYMEEKGVQEVLVLYGASTFLSQDSIQKLAQNLQSP